MKRTIFKVVYLLVLALFIFLAAKGVMQNKGAPEEIAEKLVEVENAKILEENEEKLVLISGKMETDAILEFKEQGVKVNSPILERKVEMYQYLRDDDNYDSIVRGWSDEEPEKKLKDVALNIIYENPIKAIEDDIQYANVKVGEFIIEADVIKRIKTNAVFTNFELIPEGYRVTDEKVLTSSLEGQMAVGDYRMEFHYLDLEETDEYTFLGLQKDGKIQEYKLDTGKGILKEFKGNLSKDEALKEYAAQEKRGQYVSFVLLGIVMVIGFFVFKPAKK